MRTVLKALRILAGLLVLAIGGLGIYVNPDVEPDLRGAASVSHRQP